MTEDDSSSDVVSLEDWRKIEVLALDVDGVLTNGTIFIGADGFELKQFSILDGLGLMCLRKVGVALAVISGRESPATVSRTKELKFDHVIQGRKDKVAALKELAAQLGLSGEQLCYMGDDVIDIPAIEYAGVGVSVPNGLAAVRRAANWTTRNPGGHGAVREVCDRILESRNESVLSLSISL